MKPGHNNVIGVGTWVEGSRRNGRWYLVDPSDPRSWFLFPILTFRKWLS